MSELLTPSQTVGPFFHDALLRPDARRDVMVEPEGVGRHIRVEGTVLDGQSVGVPDAMLELWQADATGHYNSPGDGSAAESARLVGYGRVPTDQHGAFSFTTIKPGAVPYIKEGDQAPHICVSVFARGLLNHLYTRIYFGDEAATERDPILQQVPADRRPTLVAQPVAKREGDVEQVYRFDIALQGDRETVFFDLG